MLLWCRFISDVTTTTARKVSVFKCDWTYTVHESVSTPLGSFDEEKVCSAQPVSVEHNCSL